MMKGEREYRLLNSKFKTRKREGQQILIHHQASFLSLRNVSIIVHLLLIIVDPIPLTTPATAA